jgi:hypothetical protein
MVMNVLMRKILSIKTDLESAKPLCQHHQQISQFTASKKSLCIAVELMKCLQE